MQFDFYSPPQLKFGAGAIKALPEAVLSYGTDLLCITGESSFQKTEAFSELIRQMKRKNISVRIETVSAEPSPDQIDRITGACRDRLPDVVAAIGGGSAIDAGKAISAMLTQNASVRRFLEGVGDLAHDGRKIPFMACPTTAGTGSEATKNAVITQVGENGFKKSLRHDRFVPDMALVDPELTCSCPALVTAACGMDALTQLIESLVSVKATPMTDALALGALQTLGSALIESMNLPEDIQIRSRISYAAYISGLTLANAGLGPVHGFAGVVGGLKPAPHGQVCGTLLAEVTRANIEHLKKNDPDNPAIEKYGRAAICLNPGLEKSTPLDRAARLVQMLEEWTETLEMPKLSDFQINPGEIETIAALSSQKNNPCLLPPEKMQQILLARL